MAFKGAGAILNIASALSGTGIAISAATVASPIVLTTAAQTFAAGDLGVIAGVVGMTQLNNRAFIMKPVGSTTSVTLPEDGTKYTTYVSGGTIQKYTMETVGSVVSAKGFDGQASEIDTSNLQSLAKEFVLGLQDYGSMSIELFMDNTDAGQAQMRSIKTQAIPWPFSLQLADGRISAFMAYVKQFGFDGVKPEGAVSVPCTLRVTNAPMWFA